MEDRTRGNLISVRNTQAIMIFFGVVAAFMMRTNISVGIVAMTSNTSRTDLPILPWDTQIKTVILSSFFWGYMCLQLPAGLLCLKYGPKPLMFISILMCGLITLITPFLASNLSWKIVVVSRVVQGLGQGCLFPSIYALASKWSPPQEMNRFMAIVFSGTQAGTIITLFITGLLAASPGGWPSIFYLSGSCGILWAILWWYLGANSPAEHTFISQKERDMIESSLVHSLLDSKNMKIPWSKICRSGPMWAILVSHFCQNWAFWTLLSLMPSYLSSAFQVDIKRNGFISSLPYLLNWMFTIVFSRVADTINKKKLLSRTRAKKMWNTIGMWGTAAGLIGLTLSKSLTLAIALLTLSISINFGIFFGFLSNHLDLGPNFACILMGITNCLSNSASFIAPLVAGFILEDESNMGQWNTVYYITAFILFIGNVVFIIFGTASLQPWNEPKKTLDEEEAEIPLKTVSRGNFTENGIKEKNNVETL